MTRSLPHVCFYCREKEATARYVHAGIDEVVCSACLQRLTVRAALEDRLIEIVTLESIRRYDDALACLDAIFEANRHLDDDQWLARSIAMHRENILHDAGRHAEALDAYDEAERLGFENVTYRWLHGLGKARTLQALGRHEDALAAFEEAFSHQDSRYASGTAYYLPVLAELYEGVGRPVDEKWRDVARMVEEEYGIKMPVRKTLAKSMRVLSKLTGRMKTKRQKEWEKKNQGKADDP